MWRWGQSSSGRRRRGQSFAKCAGRGHFSSRRAGLEPTALRNGAPGSQLRSARASSEGDSPLPSAREGDTLLLVALALSGQCCETERPAFSGPWLERPRKGTVFFPSKWKLPNVEMGTVLFRAEEKGTVLCRVRGKGTLFFSSRWPWAGQGCETERPAFSGPWLERPRKGTVLFPSKWKLPNVEMGTVLFRALSGVKRRVGGYCSTVLRWLQRRFGRTGTAFENGAAADSV